MELDGDGIRDGDYEDEIEWQVFRGWVGMSWMRTGRC